MYIYSPRIISARDNIGLLMSEVIGLDLKWANNQNAQGAAVRRGGSCSIKTKKNELKWGEAEARIEREEGPGSAAHARRKEMN